MNDDELDARLRGWGADGRADAPPASVPVEHLASGRGRRPLMLAGAAAAVVVLAIGGTLIGQRSGHRSSPATESIAAPTPGSRATAPAGYRAFTVHGLTIDVPANWPVNATECGTPVKDTVVLPHSSIPYCAISPAPDVSSVSFADYLPAPPNSLGGGGLPGYEPTKISGLPAFEFNHGSGVFRYIVPSLYVAVDITSPDEALAQSLAKSVRVVQVDSSGCDVMSEQLIDLPAHIKPARAGAGQALVPGSPRSVAACRYAGGLVEDGPAITPSQLSTLIATLNSQPAGRSKAPPDSYDAASTCRHSNVIGHGASRDFTEDSVYYRIQADYASGPPVVVIVRLGWCKNLGASNGSYSVQRTSALVDAIANVFAASGGWPTDVTKAS